MACRYFLGEKELIGDELTSYMNSISHENKLKIAPEIANNSYQAISWTPGEAQAARYDLSKHIKEIEHYSIDTKEGKKYVLGITQKNGEGFDLPKKSFSAEELPDIVGKEIADKIVNNEGKLYRGHDGKTLENLDLKVGGEWTKKFYDKLLVDIANSIAKKFGGKVEQNALANWKSNNNQPIHVLRLTPELKKAALEKGFPLFTGGFSLAPVSHDPFVDNKQKYKLTPVQGNPFQ